MSKDLYELADQVVDENSFLDFLAALAQDKEDEDRKESVSPSSPWGPGANGWENGTIAAFLDAVGSWGESSKNGMPLYALPPNPWTRAAHIIHAGKFYE